MPSASVQSGSTAMEVPETAETVSLVEAAADVWYSARYYAQPSQINQDVYAAMV
jgi:hypothetical protein